MGEFVCSPTCNQVLSTYDVSHVMNFTRLSPFLLFAHGETLGMRLGRYNMALTNMHSDSRFNPSFGCVLILYYVDPLFGILGHGRREDCGGPGQIQNMGAHTIDRVRGGLGHAPRKFCDFTCSEVCFWGF